MQGSSLYYNDRKVHLNEILSSLDEVHDVAGPHDVFVVGPAPLDVAPPGTITFCNWSGEKAVNLIRETRASVVIIPSSLELADLGAVDKTLIRVANARLTFARVVHKHFAPAPQVSGVHPTAILGTNVKLGTSISIGPYCVIENDCVIGDEVRIDPGVTLYRGTWLGNRAVLRAGAVIGAEGFGYERLPGGQWLIFPQMARVMIGDDVEIGANTCVDRGALTDTVVGNGTKVDNLVHVAHNVTIGENCMVIAHAKLGGSVVVGSGTWVGLGASVREKLHIGRNVLIGMGAVVVEDVPDDVVVAGVPARVIRRNT